MGKKKPRQKQAIERARQRQSGRKVRRPPHGQRSDLVEYRQWASGMVEVARCEIGISDTHWVQIADKCVGHYRVRVSVLRQTYGGASIGFCANGGPGYLLPMVGVRTRWLVCEQAVAVNEDGSLTPNPEVVAVLTALPVDDFEGIWQQVTQPAFAMFQRCSNHIEQGREEDLVGWLCDLHQFATDTFGPCAALAVDATIDALLTDYFLGDVQQELKRSGLDAAVTGASARFDDLYRHATAPPPSVTDITDLGTSVAGLSAWLDTRSANTLLGV